jgi:hypothetical protein
MEITTPD